MVCLNGNINDDVIVRIKCKRIQKKKKFSDERRMR